jgi:uncharacterized protein
MITSTALTKRPAAAVRTGTGATRIGRLSNGLRRSLASVLCGALCALSLASTSVRAQETIPELTQPVNDFAKVIDPESARNIDALIRSLQQASGDVVVVATVPTYEPYGDIREYAVKMFENRGRGIGQKGKDNGLLVLLAVSNRQVWVEVGYDLEQFITDGFAGETSRDYMVPEFRSGAYGRGLFSGVSRIIGRIAEQRNVTLQGAPAPRRTSPNRGGGVPIGLVLFVAFILLNAVAGRLRGNRSSRRRGWHSGVGPFGGGFGGGLGGGFGGGFGGGGFGGGFGGFGGGRSGGGGGGGSW